MADCRQRAGFDVALCSLYWGIWRWQRRGCSACRFRWRCRLPVGLQKGGTPAGICAGG